MENTKKEITISLDIGGSWHHYIFNTDFQYKDYFSSQYLTEEEIDNMSYTGKMTEEEFNTMYEGADFKGSWTEKNVIIS